ncbi:MAG: nitrate ABC transporter substrate-binding protein [Alcanivorax sp.]|nr:nitrate ABC transporter substrate-binding protein [Alcanivorax sp.]MCQ6262741.1 ABC transporter substrate-binding protein [Alcanivorax sp. MM125-6]
MKKARESRFEGIGKGVRRTVAGLVLGAGLLGTGVAGAEELTELTFGTNWFAQAEHGGFYQAKATGIYEKYGLDVSIEMGGPQVNNVQLLLAGKQDVTMGYPIRNIKSLVQDLPVVTIAAPFQSDPQALLAHPHVKSLEEIKGKPVYVFSGAKQTFWPWLEANYGFTDDMIRPYTFSVQPFLADDSVVQQGYVTSEPYAMEKGGVTPSIFLFAEYGYPPYAQTLETTRDMVAEQPEVLRKFVQASMEGWKSYFENPAPGNELIKQDNPEMTDEQIAFGIDKMKEYGLVSGGDAQEKGLGVMTDERWKATFDFMAKAGMVPEDLDYKQAYTLEFLPEEPVLP